jgi:putative transposase
MFIQIAERKSLRAGVRNIAVMRSGAYHLGLAKVAGSTFSDANNKRPALFFKELFGVVLAKASSVSRKHKFKFNNPLFSLDSTTIDLNKQSFPWAEFRRNKSGIKLHTVLDHNGYLPSLVDMTQAKTSDVKAGKKIKFGKGDIVVFDRAYNDYGWYEDLTSRGVFFVTRLKTNTDYVVIKRNSAKGKITSDQVIKLKKTGLVLRRVALRDKTTGKHYKFLTNNFKLAASTIGLIYKDRWEIEKFFRWIKQNLKTKTFVGRSENAVLSQVYVALIAYLLLAILKHLSKISQSLQQILQIMQLNLMEKVSIEFLFKPPEENKNICKFKMLSLIC